VRSWLRHCASSRHRSRVRFPIMSLEIFIAFDIGHTVALGVDSASNRNEYQEYFLGGKCSRCVELTTLSPSHADCHEIWERQTSGNLWYCNRQVMGLLYLLLLWNSTYFAFLPNQTSTVIDSTICCPFKSAMIKSILLPSSVISVLIASPSVFVHLPLHALLGPTLQ